MKAYFNSDSYAGLTAAIEDNPRKSAIAYQVEGHTQPGSLFLIRAIYETKNIAGDVCEFGVAQGETSALIANEIGASGRHFHLFDFLRGCRNLPEKDILIDDIEDLKICGPILEPCLFRQK